MYVAKHSNVRIAIDKAGLSQRVQGGTRTSPQAQKHYDHLSGRIEGLSPRSRHYCLWLMRLKNSARVLGLDL